MVTSASSAFVRPAERPAGRGEHDAAHPVARRRRRGAGRAGTGGRRSARCRPGPARRRPAAARTRRTTGPAAISDSLLASASRVPAPSDGQRDAEPGEADHAVDAHVAEPPRCRRQRVGAGDDLGARRAPAPASSAALRVVGDGDDRRAATAAPARRAGRPTTPRPSAATENRSGSAAITSSACVPIDPVDPAIDDGRGHRREATDGAAAAPGAEAAPPALVGGAAAVAEGRLRRPRIRAERSEARSVTKLRVGAELRRRSPGPWPGGRRWGGRRAGASKRSSRPPWPGRIVPMSFTPRSRLTSDSHRSPSGAAMAMARPTRSPSESSSIGPKPDDRREQR